MFFRKRYHPNRVVNEAIKQDREKKRYKDLAQFEIREIEIHLGVSPEEAKKLHSAAVNALYGGW